MSFRSTLTLTPLVASLLPAALLLMYLPIIPFFVQLPTASVNTAVHVEDLSCYLTCLCQIEDRVHNVLYVSNLPHWLQLLKEFLGIIRVHRRIHHARGYSVEADIVFCILNREAPNDCVQASLSDHRDRAIYAEDRLIGKRRRDAYDVS
jgi:hypothetical protein